MQEYVVMTDANIKKLCILDTAAEKLYHHQTYLYCMNESVHKDPFPVTPTSIKIFMWWMATDQRKPASHWTKKKKDLVKKCGPRMHTYTYLKNVSGKLISYIKEKGKVEGQLKKYAKNGDVAALQSMVIDQLKLIKG